MSILIALTYVVQVLGYAAIPWGLWLLATRT